MVAYEQKCPDGKPDCIDSFGGLFGYHNGGIRKLQSLKDTQSNYVTKDNLTLN